MVLATFAGVGFAAAPYSEDISDDLAVMLVDADSGFVMHEQQADVQIKPASTTKILTLLAALENSSLSDIVTVSANAAGVSGSQLKIKNGEEFVLEDLLYGMMLVSGNDAATAVAEHVSGTVDGFVALMNELANEIGMEHSHFANPHGKDDDDHYVTARDMTLLAAYAMKNAKFMEIVGVENYTLPETNKQNSRVVDNYDYLIRSDNEFFYQYANGIKTGTTNGAGGCLVSSATKDGTNLIFVVFGDQTKNGGQRWPLAASLFDYGFENYVTLDALTLIDTEEPLSEQVENYANNDIYDGMLEFLQPMPAQRYITLDKSTAEAILNGTDSIEIIKAYTDEESLLAPIEEGEVVGTVMYKSVNTGAVLFSGNLVASRDVLDAGSQESDFGDTEVLEMPATVPEDFIAERERIKLRNNNILYGLLILPAGLVVFLIIRVLSVKKHKRRRYTKKRKPRYSYKIKK